jgi:uncharacterized protein (DUF1778 family)
MEGETRDRRIQNRGVGPRVQGSRRDRLVVRVSANQKALVLKAAALTGRRLTDLVLSSAQAAAEDVIGKHRTIELTSRETEAFLAVLESPPEPNDRLRAAAVERRRLASAGTPSLEV